MTSSPMQSKTSQPIPLSIKKVSKDTPSTWSELSASEKAAAKKEKKTKGRVSRYKKKKGGAVQGCGCPYGMEIGPNKVL